MTDNVLCPTCGKLAQLKEYGPFFTPDPVYRFALTCCEHHWRGRMCASREEAQQSETHNMKMQPGLYQSMPYHAYRSYGAFGGTDAVHLATHSPAHWREYRKQPATPAMTFGSAAHCLLLEGPYEFDRRYAVRPDFDRRTKNGKESHLEFVAEHAGDEIITPLEYNTLVGMEITLQANKTAMEVLQSCGLREVSVFWDDPVSNIGCCGRLDFLGYRIAGDLKTTADASPFAFKQTVRKYGYHIQAAHYMDGLNECGRYPEQFLFIAIEKSPPYGIGVYELSEDLLNEGKRLAMTARLKFQEAEQNGYWSYQDGIVTLGNGFPENIEL